MAKTRYLSTTTTVNYNETGQVDVVLNYNGKPTPCSNNIPHIKNGRISPASININGVAVKEGEAYLNVMCYPSYIQTTMDESGKLLITVYDDREKNYRIDSDTGSLIFELERR